MPGIMKNKKLLCSVCFLFAFMSALWGQNITVKGNVTSKTDGQPIIDVYKRQLPSLPVSSDDKDYADSYQSFYNESRHFYRCV